jgi:hypothetical protein
VLEHKEKSREIKGYCERLFELGYVTLPIAPGHKYPALFEDGGWRPHRVNDFIGLCVLNNCLLWDSWGASAGIHFWGTGQCGIDIDCLNAEISKDIQQIADSVFGVPRMLRIGKAPKAMLIYRCDPDTRYRRWTLDGDNKVELLAGDNRMAVMLGKHPDTGQPYHIEGPLLPADKLAMANPFKLDLLFTKLLEKYPGSYLSIPGESRETADESDHFIRLLSGRIPPVSPGLRGRFELARDNDIKLRELWEHGTKDKDTSQSGLIFRLAYDLRRRGYEPLEFASLAITWPLITHGQQLTARSLGRAWARSVRDTSKPLNEADWFEPSPGPRPGQSSKFDGGPFTVRAIRAPEYLYGSLQRGYVYINGAMTKTGKSAFAVAGMLAMVTGRKLLQFQPCEKLRVGYWNGEDPQEAIELRVQGAMLHYRLNAADLSDRMRVSTAERATLTVAYEDGHGVTVHEPDVLELRKWVESQRLDVLVIDPFVSTHTVNELDNQAVYRVMTVWTALAKQLQVAIWLVHHLRKTMAGSAVDIESIRGASSMIAAARSADVMVRMDAATGKRLGLAKEYGRYFRIVDSQSNNLRWAALDTLWFRLESVQLDNGWMAANRHEPGEHFVSASEVPVVVTWQEPDELTRAGLLGDEAVAEIRRLIGEGKWRYRNRVSSEEPWAGLAIARVMGKDAGVDRREISKTLDGLIARGDLVVVRGYSDRRNETAYVEIGKAISPQRGETIGEPLEDIFSW